MPVIVKDNGSGDFERPEAGLQHAVCSHVVDLGMQPTPYGDKHKVAICFELAQKMKDGRPFMQTQQFTASLNEKATLRKWLEVWRGKKFTIAELAAFDLETLVGVNCYLNLVENSKDGKTYVNISSVVKLPNGVEHITPTGQPAPKWLAEKAAGIQHPADASFANNGPEEKLPF